MTFFSPSRNIPSRNIIPAGLGLFLSCFFSVLNINAFGHNVSFILLPLLMVALWPRRVNAVFTVITFFLIGIFMDWGTNGIIGQWSLTYLAVFAVLRPDRRDKTMSFVGTIWLGIFGLFIGTIMLIVTGWFIYSQFPDFANLARQIIVILLLLPLIVFLRNIVRFFLTDPDDRDYL